MATSYTDKDSFYYWTRSSGDTSSTTSTATDTIWCNWITTDDVTGGTTNTITNGNIWEAWHTKVVYEKVQKPFISRVVTSPKQTSEKSRASAVQRKINNEWREIRIKEEQERKQRAELTAQELLLDLIGEQELAHYRKTGRLLVKGRKYDYVIRRQGGVYKVEKGKVIDLCIHLRDQYKYPATDNVIGILLMIKVEEAVFLKTANSHGELRNAKIKGEILELVEKAA